MTDTYTVEDFLNIKSAGGPSFSPDGSTIAFFSNLTGMMQLYLAPREGGKPVQLTFYDEPVSFAGFSPVKNEILFGMAKGGDERTQLFLFDVGTRSARALTNDPEHIYRLAGWSRDGAFITYSSNKRNGTDFDVCVMNVMSGESKMVFGEGGSCDSLGFSPLGTMVAVRKRHEPLLHTMYLVNLASGIAEAVSPEGEKAILGTPRWLPDESGFFFASNRDRDIDGLCFYDVRKKTETYVLTPEREVDDGIITHDGKYIAVFVNNDGYDALTVYDTETLAPLPDQNFPKGLIRNARWSHDGNYLVFSLTTATKNGDIWIWSKKDNICTQITESPRTVPEDICVEPELVRYESFDGLSVPAFVFLPKSRTEGEKFPAVINIHGGPASQYRPYFSSVTQYLVYRGYAVIAPNVRGSSGYGKKYLALDDIEKRMDSVTDLKYLHRYLATRGDIDEKRIALMGGSYGGYMTLAGLTFYPELWAAGVDIVGMSNLVSFLENTSPWRRALREAEYGSLSKHREFLASISPLNFIERIQAPLLIIHGANDPRVPLSEAQQIHTKLQELKRTSELLVYDDEGHGLSKLKNILDAYPKVTAFFDSVLKTS